MTDRQKQWIVRIVTGGLLGIAAHMLLGYALGCFSLMGPARFTGFRFPDCNFSSWNYCLEWLGVLLSFALFFLFGAEVGVATLPFADSGRSLVLRSLAHFAVMAATVAVWAGLNVSPRPGDLAYFLLPLALVYLLVWLGRWVGWYVEVAALRQKLGLAPGPSLFHWRETLPYLAFALLLCDLLPAVLRAFDPADVPILTSLLLPLLLLPAGGFCSGISLGRRQGFCPLYPLACGLFALPPVFLLYSSPPIFHCVIVLCAAFLGNITGGGMRRLKARRRGDPRVL